MHCRVSRTAGFALLLLATPACADGVAVLGNSEQQQKVQTSLSACPGLASELQRLQQAGSFSDIRIAPKNEVARSGPFEAAIQGHEILMTSDWLAAQKLPFFDVRTPGEILPDNLCFGLGHLTDHLAHPMTLQPSQTNIEEWLKTKLDLESAAFLAGWSYVREAALAKTAGAPLTGTQVGQLLINLRYRFAFYLAMGKNANPRLHIANDASIPATDKNITAITNALRESAIADLQ